MTYGRSINIDSRSRNNSDESGASVLIRRRAHGRLSAARLALFGISPREAEFSVRGFSATDPARQDRLETVGRSFVAGYNAAIATGQGDAALEQLAEFPEALRGFVVEGAAMGLALLDIVTPWPRRSFIAFVAGAAEPYTYLAYVGAGWALARTSWRLAGRLGRLDPLLRWLMFDGFGFHAGYFLPRRVFDQHWRPGLPQGYAAQAFDQGLGRALWFAMGASGEKVRAAVETFAPERRPDLWSGIGLAAAYAGGASTEELTALVQAAGGSRLDLGQGAAFAAAAHLRAGVLPDHTEAACQVLCGADGHTASALTAEVRPDPEADPAGQHYEAWRGAIRAGIAAGKGDASC
jgi:enediyne biosynthesis protein E3